MAQQQDPSVIRGRILRKGPPKSGFLRIFKMMVPSGKSVFFVIVSIVILGLGILIFELLNAMLVPTDPSRPTDTSGLIHLLFSIFIIPIVALFLLIGSLIPNRAGGRVMVLFVLASVMILGGVSCQKGMVSTNVSSAGSTMVAITMYGSSALIVFAWAFAGIAYLPKRLRQELHRDQLDYVEALLAEQGFAQLDSLAQQLELSADELREILIELIAKGRLFARVDDRTAMIFSAAYVQWQLGRLLSLITSRGRESLTNLESGLGIGQSVIEGWIGELQLAGVLTATIDRSRGIVIWDHKGNQGGNELLRQSCKSCGGATRAVGGGLFRCVYCDAEVTAEEVANQGAGQ